MDELNLNNQQKYIIYPFGINGMITKGLLNSVYGINEVIVVDQNSDYVERVKKITDIEYAYQYKWILNCTDKDVHNICRKELDKIVEDDNIIDFYRIIKKKIYSEKIEKCPTIDVECKEFLDIIKKMKIKGSVSVAEIGIGVGATSVQVVHVLEHGDTFTLMDFEEKC